MKISPLMDRNDSAGMVKSQVGSLPCTCMASVYDISQTLSSALCLLPLTQLGFAACVVCSTSSVSFHAHQLWWPKALVLAHEAAAVESGAARQMLDMCIQGLLMMHKSLGCHSSADEGLLPAGRLLRDCSSAFIQWVCGAHT